MLVDFMPEAEEEIDEAADYYAAHDDRGELEQRFLAEVERVARLIGENPRAWTEVEPGVRRAVLNRFPFSLIYALEPDQVLVLAVAHHSRRAGYWRERRP